MNPEASLGPIPARLHLTHSLGFILFVLVYAVLLSVLGLLEKPAEQLVFAVLVHLGFHIGVPGVTATVISGSIITLFISALMAALVVNKLHAKTVVRSAVLMAVVLLLWQLSSFFYAIAETGAKPGSALMSFYDYLLIAPAYVPIRDYLLIPFMPLLVVYLLRQFKGRLQSGRPDTINEESRSPA